MTNEFERNVLGYNIAKYIYGSVSLLANEFITISGSNGPGEIMGLGILVTNGNFWDVHNALLTFTVDGTVIWNDAFWAYVGEIVAYTFHHMIWNCDVQSSTYMALSSRIKIPYDSSFSFVFKNTGSVGTLNMIIGMYMRYGDT